MRLGQGNHVTTILASLFDIIHDKSIVGIKEESRSSLSYSKPIGLFDFDDDAAIAHFMQKTESYDELVSLQFLFIIRQKSLKNVDYNEEPVVTLRNLLLFFNGFIREIKERIEGYTWQ